MKDLISESKSYDREGKILDAIRDQNAYLPEESKFKKYQKMVTSPYIFYRGTNHLFWQDFAGSWRLHQFGGASWSRTWLQGDSHVYNMGAFKHQGENVCFGFDDFDDSLVADYQYDIWRFAISIVLDCWGRDLHDSDEIDSALDTFSSSYLLSFKETIKAKKLLAKRFTSSNTCKPLAKFLEKTQEKSSRRKMLEKWTSGEHDRHFELNSDKVRALDSPRREQLIDALGSYRERRNELMGLEYSDCPMQILDVVERLGAGTGSLGNQRFYALIRDIDKQNQDHDFILDIKLQGQPTAYGYLSQEETDEYNNNFLSHAVRHADAYTALSDFPDHHLGWVSLDNGSYSVRERCPYKRDFDTSKLSSKEFLLMARQWGEVLALKHRRAARRLNQNQEISPLEEKLKTIAESHCWEFNFFIRSLAQPYAQQVRRDWEAFRANADALLTQ